LSTINLLGCLVRLVI